jgi:hypothetical protein
LKPLAGLIAVLVALLGWESLPAPSDPTGIASVVMPPASATPPESPAPLAAWTNVVLARPLFARDRRPTPDAPSMPSRSAAPDALPRLAGTVRSNDTLMAIFVLAGLPSASPTAGSLGAAGPGAVNPTPGGPTQGGSSRNGTTPDAGENPVVVRRDGIVAGWTVMDIMDSAVTLERDGRSVTLRLSYANQPAAAHVAAPKALVVLLHDKRTNPSLQP